MSSLQLLTYTAAIDTARIEHVSLRKLAALRFARENLLVVATRSVFVDFGLELRSDLYDADYYVSRLDV